MTRSATHVSRGALAVIVATTAALGACSGGDADDGPAELDRIDGPAQVDPDAEVGGVSDETDE